MLLRNRCRGLSTSVADCHYDQLGPSAPAFVIADYEVLERPLLDVHYLRGHDTSAANYADAAEKAEPLIAEWFGAPREKAQAADLPHVDEAPFESGALMLMSVRRVESESRRTVRGASVDACFLLLVPSLDRGRPRPFCAGSLSRTGERDGRLRSTTWDCIARR